VIRVKALGADLFLALQAVQDEVLDMQPTFDLRVGFLHQRLSLCHWLREP